MFRAHPMALTAILMLGAASLAHAQQSANDSTREARDLSRDKQTLATDTMRLHRDIAVRDSVHTALLAERSQRKTDEARLDSLQTALTRARKASPRDTAAVNRDESSIKQLKATLERERDRDKVLEHSLKRDEMTVRKESRTTNETHRDIHSDRSKTSSASDLRRDERIMATDTVKLHRDIAVRDSVHSALLAERSQRKTDEARLDSLQTALAGARKASPHDTAAVNRDESSIKQLQAKLERERDRDTALEHSLKRDELAVRTESHATIETHRDIRSDRSKPSTATATHPTTSPGRAKASK